MIKFFYRKNILVMFCENIREWGNEVCDGYVLIGIEDIEL